MNEESIFLEALQKHTPTEQADYLDQACAGDDNLRRGVEKLLKAHAKAGQFLKQLPAEFDPTCDRVNSEVAGIVIGPYKLLQKIGEGGMGVVWMAEQTQPVHRKVALKVIKPGMDSRQVIARFEAERQALAMMDHVNIARVFDGGTMENGRPYFVMELVHGVPITKYCDDNHLTPRERLELFVPVCQAIQHAHQKGIIHRDIKPSNVMVTLYDGKPVPKVIDFGVAKATEQKLTERTLFTQYGTMVGTLEYMSPEQAEMSALGVDTRSDIYSLGVLLYELLTGSTPLSHKRMKEAGYAEILRMIKEEQPPKPSTRLSDSGEALASISANRHTEPGKLTKLVRGELDWIVMKTLEKDRNRRYETANAFAAEVQRYLNDEQVLACPPSLAYRLKKFVRRNKAAVGVGGVVVASLTLAVGALLLTNEALADKTRITLQAKEQTDDALAEKTKALAEKTTALTEKSTALTDLKNAHETLERKAYYQGITLGELRWLNADVSRAEKELGSCPLHLRGWEWHYLKNLCRTELQVFKPDHPIVGIHISPDGQRLAAIGALAKVVLDPKGNRYPSAIKIWDIKAGQLLFHHVGTQANGGGLVTSPNCQWIASAHQNGTVDLWDLQSGKKAWTVPGAYGGGMSQTLFSPDGEHVATRTDKHGVQLWDLKTGKLVRTLPGHGAELFSWAFSQDRRQLVTGGYTKAGKKRGDADATVHIWDVVSGKKLLQLVGGLNDPRFSPDGRLLAGVTRGADGVTAGAAAQVWDLTQPEGKLVHTLQLKDYRLSGVIFSPDGQWIATQEYLANVAGNDYQLTVWSVKSGLAHYSLHARTGNTLQNLRFSTDGQRLTATEGALVRIWQAATGQELLTLRGHTWITSLAFLPDGRLASAGDNEIRIWDTANPQEAHVVRHRMPAFSVVFSPDGRLGASASYKEIKIWDAASGKEIKSWSFLPGGPRQIHFSPDSTRVAAIDYIEGKPPSIPVKVWETTTGKEIFALEGTGFNRSLAFSPDGKWLATAGGNWGVPSGVFIWNALTGKEVKVLPGLESELHTVAFSPDSKLVAAATFRALKVWDLATGKEVFSKQLPPQSLPSKGRVLFSPDGCRLAWVGGGPGLLRCELKVWNLAKGEELLTRKLQIENLGSVAFSPNSKLITSAEPSRPGRTVFLWDIATDKEAGRLVSESGQVKFLAFNPKGDRIAIATGDGNLKLWDAVTHQEMLVLRGHADKITDLTFSPDGHRIATASWDQMVRIWDATPRK